MPQGRLARTHSREAAGLFHSTQQNLELRNGETKARARAPRLHNPSAACADRAANPISPVAQTHLHPRTAGAGALRLRAYRLAKESIAFDLGLARSTLGNLARSEGWERFVPPPRGLPPAVRLRREVEKLEATAEEASRPVENLQSAMPAVGDTVERLYRAVLAELAVENLRAQLKREPQGTQDAERTVRTLSSLTETLQKLQRLKSAVPNTGSQDDDLPADIDEFCKELARRIEAFVANRTGGGEAERPANSLLPAALR